MLCSRFRRYVSDVSPCPWILLGIAVLTIAIYGQTARHAFINLDDETLIYRNAHVQSGLTWENLRWAFSATSGASYWHPLTWLSHMADVELFGLNAGAHHLVSVGIHILNAMMLFLVLLRMTGSTWRSGFVAALFAVHPLHVESVAWVSGRRDMLSTLFFLLSMRAYTIYAQRPTMPRYLVTALFFAMALMSKPMAMTLPFVLLLLDWWPLSRIGGTAPREDRATIELHSVSWRRILWEKVPLLLMAAGSAVVTLRYHEQALRSLDAYPLSMRIANALVSYATYLWKTVIPSALAVYYPHPASINAVIPASQIAGSIVLLLGLSLVALRRPRRRPYLAVGWLWYLGMLFPVIQLVQAGEQAMADRFTYLPLTGVFVGIAWGIPSAIGARRLQRLALGMAGVAAIIGLSVAAWHQTRYWRNDVTLFSHALAVTQKNWLALQNLGVAYSRSGQYDEAIACFRVALLDRPDDFMALHGMGVALIGSRQYRQAIDVYRIAVGIKADSAETWQNLGLAYAHNGQYQEAIASFLKASRIKPDFAEAYYSLGLTYSKLGKYWEAIESYREAVKIKPDFADAWHNLGVSYNKVGETQLANACYLQGQRLK